MRQDTYSAEAHSLMNDFNNALEHHAKTENCFGKNGLNETVIFTTKDFLVDYWTDENVDGLLLSLPGQGSYDTSLILREYIVVFSILTRLHKSDWISKFLGLQIKDSSLPLRRDSNAPNSWADPRQTEELWKDFINEQWMFCPYMFDRLSDAELSESYILPIQNKERLQSDADDGDLATLYKVKLHPSCRGNLVEYVVFKEYQRSDPIAAPTYENEISIYKALKPGSAAFNNIIEYYGSFQILGRRTIMLEYANGGDLLTFFKEAKPPSQVEHLNVFWTNFFDLLLGLEAIHNLLPPNSGRGSWFLEGIHQDIRPQNVLLVRKPSSRHTYDVTFKLVDFGTGYIKKQSIDQLRTRHRDNLGNAIYSSPESVHNRMKPESDVWALGALASEVLVWSIRGWNGVENFFNLRGAQTMQELPDTHRACFHDGIHRLSVIDTHHREVLKERLVEDKVSLLVSKMILEHMLVELPSALDNRASSNSQFRHTSSETHRLWSTKLRIISSTNNSPADDIRGRPQHTVTEPILMTASPESYSQPWAIDAEDSAIMDRYSSVPPRRPEVPLHSFHESYGQQYVHRGPGQYFLHNNQILHNENSIESPSTRMILHKLDRSSIIKSLMENTIRNTEGTITQRDDNLITIERLHDKFIAAKDGKSQLRAAFSKLKVSSSDQYDPLKAHPDLGKAISRLKNSGSSGREQIFLVDDSKSMTNFQTSIAKTVRVLAYLIKKGDVDPDRSIELRFATQIGQKVQNSNSKPLEDAVKNWPFDNSVCEMGTALDSLLLSILPNRYASDPKPVSIYVLTNGLWSDDDPASLCGVDEAIEKALRRLDAHNAELAKKWLGIQFIGFFNRRSPTESTLGRRRLQFLDDKLGELFQALDLKFTRNDIVDTREWDDDVKDILLGAVYDVVDKKA